MQITGLFFDKGYSVIKVLIVDDHDLVRMGLCAMLSGVEDFDVVATVASGEEAVQQCRALQPHVVLMDVRMPGIGGLEASRKIQQHNPAIQIIGVSACEEAVFAQQLMEAGAKGYVTKGADIAQVIEAIHSVMDGKRYMSRDIAQALAFNSLNKDEPGNPFERLSQREMQTALLIASGKRAQEIADAFCVSPKTVNSYRYRIFEKLDLNSDVELTLLLVKHNMLDPQSVV